MAIWNRVCAPKRGATDVFVHDRRTGVTTLIPGPVAGGNNTGPLISADGRVITFGTGNGKIYLYDRTSGVVEPVGVASDGTEANDWSFAPSLSGDGRYVAFKSTSANLVAEDTNRRSDIFVHDRVAGPEARFAWSGLSVTPDTVRAGARVRVTANVKNVGEKDGSYEAVLRIGGEVEQRRTVEVGKGRSVRLTFDVRRADAGTYTVAVGPLTGEFTVRRR